MDIVFDLKGSIKQLYESLIEKDVYAQKALVISFFPQFRSDKKVDHEPLDFCKFIFWRRTEDNAVDILFSDDLVMDEKRKGKRVPGENTIFLHIPFVWHFSEFPNERLKKIAKILKEKESAPFFVEKITLNSVFVMDLKPEQFQGGLLPVEEMCWEWDRENKKFNPV